MSKLVVGLLLTYCTNLCISECESIINNYCYHDNGVRLQAQFMVFLILYKIKRIYISYNTMKVA